MSTTNVFITASVIYHQLPFARCSFHNEAKFKLVTALTKQSTTAGNSIQLHAKCNSTSGYCVFTWNASITGSEFVTVWLPVHPHC